MGPSYGMPSGSSGRPRATGVLRIAFWLEYAYLIRFPIGSGLLLAVVLPASYFLVPSVFVGLFDACGKWSLLFITWVALSLAWTIMVTSRLVLVYAPDRYPGVPPVGLGTLSPGVAFCFGLLAVPLLVLVAHGSGEISPWGKGFALAVGAVLAIAMLFAAALIHFSIEPLGHTTAQRVLPSFGFLASSGKSVDPAPGPNALADPLFAGIREGGRFRSGHRMASILLGMLLVAYVATGIYYFPSRVPVESEPAALFYALFLVTLLTWLFSGLAFFLDRFRIPVLTTIVAVSFVTGMLGTDHEFAVTPLAPGAAVSNLDPAKVIASWNTQRGGPGRPITVVATAGGGIQAAAWTATVLTGLEKTCPATFSSSLVLVSSVSGGSAGSMYFLAGYDGGTGKFPDDANTIENIRRNAERSSLNAVGWGLLYPDLLRTIPVLGALESETVDRGWALEDAWTERWAVVPEISSWREDVVRGTRPAVIFNATAAETGQRFVIATTDINYPAPANGTVEFSEAFRGWDMRVSTGARLSAAFPYVSPIPRASGGDSQDSGQRRLHIADGGYYDNSGVLGAVEWLTYAGDALKGHPVLLVTIDGSPATVPPGKRWSWERQLVGPLETVLDTRSSSQANRDTLESNLATKALRDVTTVTQAPFDFSNDRPVPLNWHLTTDQAQAITSYWDNPRLAPSRKMAASVLGCTNQ